MIYDNFKIAATPFIHDAFCECNQRLEEVNNGLFSKVYYCPRCENVYALKMIKVAKSKVTAEFLEQCQDAITVKNLEKKIAKEYYDKKKST